MQTREFEIRSVNEETRTVSGVAVPWNDVIEIGGIKESFERGAIESVDNVKLFWQHSEPIGLVTKGEDAEEGFVIEARISETPRGNEAYTLLKDGVINRFSVGFIPVETREQDGVYVRSKVDLKEVSLVPFPAYGNAKVSEVREDATEEVSQNREQINNEENTNMDSNTEFASTSEVRELREALEDIERKVETRNESSLIVPSYRSYGEYVKGTVAGDEAATGLYRAFANSADSVVKNGWVSDVIRLVDHGRPTVSAFSQKALPSEGNNVEYPVVSANTIASAVQTLEGDALSYGEISIGTATAAVKTYGGYASMSRQVIERSSVAYLDTAFRAMALGYAKATNAAAIAAIAAAEGSMTTSGTGATTAAAYVDAIVDATADIWDATGLTADFILVNKADYKKLVGVLDTTNRPLVAAGNPSNNMGSADVTNVRASFLGIPVIVDPALGAGKFYVGSKDAFVTYESAGAPLRLADEDITKLTRDFSVYGYAAFAVVIPQAISVVDVTP